MNKDFCLSLFLSDGFSQFGPEAGMNSAAPRPKQQADTVRKRRAFPVMSDVQHGTGILRKTELIRRINTQILIRQKENDISVVKCPAHHPIRVRGRAYRAAMGSHHGFYRQRGVYIRKRHNFLSCGLYPIQIPFRAEPPESFPT